ncbi:YraN family protein [Glaciimonas sp. PAMC28666]|nr:YraN family protein [Glaciimonas sp. PAMC28666]
MLQPERRSARQISGQLGEDAALDYLQQRQFTLIERNFSCKGGEIDLIMRDGVASLVFVEVRQRADNRHGGAAASVTISKQRRLIIAAQHFLQRYRQPPACRFDVIAIDGDVIEWIKNAFDA